MKDERVIMLSADELGQVLYEYLTERGVLKESYTRLQVVLVGGGYRCTFYNENVTIPPKSNSENENKPARMIRVDD